MHHLHTPSGVATNRGCHYHYSVIGSRSTQHSATDHSCSYALLHSCLNLLPVRQPAKPPPAHALGGGGGGGSSVLDFLAATSQLLASSARLLSAHLGGGGGMALGARWMLWAPPSVLWLRRGGGEEGGGGTPQPLDELWVRDTEAKVDPSALMDSVRRGGGGGGDAEP